MANLTRNLKALTDTTFDLVIVGGGIFGACAAWDATLRGLSVALVEKIDFSHATSANHFKMVHGGIRYLQHVDVIRIRESSKERSALLRIAPHLIQVLPIVIPTYGHGVKGKEFLGAGLAVYDLLTMDRNRGLQAERRIPKSRFLSRHEVMRLYPGIKEGGLTGGAIFCDGQMYNPPRLAMSFIRSAADRGAVVANYLEVDGFIRQGDRISGVHATDVLSGSRLEIRGNCVLNTAGPWAHRLLEKKNAPGLKQRPTFSRDLALVIERKLSSPYGLAFPTETKDSDAIVDRGGRHLFTVPWRHNTLVGVWHKVFQGAPEEISVTDTELQAIADEVRKGYPGLNFTLQEIQAVNTGLTLYGEEDRQGIQRMSFGKRSMLVDHSLENKVEGLVTLIGVRATTARGMSEKALHMVMQKLGRQRVQCRTESTPIFGGDMTSFDTLLSRALGEMGSKLDAARITGLLHNYGTQYQRVLKYAEAQPELLAPLGETTVLKAEIVHAVQEEMAQKMVDVVFRRTDLGTGGDPGGEALTDCAQLMAQEMKWTPRRLETELAHVKREFSKYRRNGTL